MTAKRKDRSDPARSEPAVIKEDTQGIYSATAENASEAVVDDTYYARTFIKDEIANTLSLKPIETCVYFKMVLYFHLRGKPVVYDRNRLAKRCGTTPDAFDKATDALISEGLFLWIDGCLWSRSVAREIAHRKEKSQKNRENKLKGREKIQQNQGRSATNDPHLRDQNQKGSSGQPSADPSLPQGRGSTNGTSEGNAPLEGASRYPVGSWHETQNWKNCQVLRLIGSRAILVRDGWGETRELVLDSSGLIIDGEDSDIPF